MYENYYPQPYPQNMRLNAPLNPFNSKVEIIRVNGRNGAEAFAMPPNSSILLLDESAPVVWLKMTDGAGYPTITAYNISPAKAEAPNFESLENRIARLEEIVNAKSNNTNDAEK